MAKKEFRKDLMHKTRRELVDYVFRGEDPSKSFGYEKSNPNVKREVGEKWEDETYQYEQKEGYVLKTGKNHEVFQSIREFLRKKEECANSNCQKQKYGANDKILIKESGYCIDCNVEMDSEAQKLGIFEEYKNFRLFRRAVAQATEAKSQIEDGIKELKPHYEQILEDGRIEIWHLPKPMDEMKADMELEIQNIEKGLKELEEDIVIYESKLKNLDNPILNRLFDAR
jgi:hypothetical protein